MTLPDRLHDSGPIARSLAQAPHPDETNLLAAQTLLSGPRGAPKLRESDRSSHRLNDRQAAELGIALHLEALIFVRQIQQVAIPN